MIWIDNEADYYTLKKNNKIVLKIKTKSHKLISLISQLKLHQKLLIDY